MPASNRVLTDATGQDILSALQNIGGVVTPVIDNLTSDDTNKALSAKQGKVLKGLIPTELSQLQDDATHRLVTDTNISNWNNINTLYQYALIDKIAQINTNVEGVVFPIAEKNYAAGEYFIQQKKLLRALTAISEGDTLTQGSNYEEVTVTDELYSKDVTNDFSWNTSAMSFTHCSASRYGNIITINIRFTITDASVANIPIITGIANKYMPSSGWLFGNVVGEWSGAVKSVVMYRLSGDNKFYFPNTAGISNGDKFTGSFTYICKGV